MWTLIKFLTHIPSPFTPSRATPRPRPKTLHGCNLAMADRGHSRPTFIQQPKGGVGVQQQAGPPPPPPTQMDRLWESFVHISANYCRQLKANGAPFLKNDCVHAQLICQVVVMYSLHGSKHMIHCMKKKQKHDSLNGKKHKKTHDFHLGHLTLGRKG